MNNNERVLTILDLFSILLRNLVPILCITLAFTLLGFAYSFRNAQKTALFSDYDQLQEHLSENEARYSVIEQTYKSANEVVQKYEEERISSLWNHLKITKQKNDQLAHYLSSSPIMSLDPYNCTVSDISLLVRNDSNITVTGDGKFQNDAGYRAAAVISSICTLDTSVLERTAQILGVSAELSYIQQLISVFNDNNIVHIRVYFTDTEAAKQAVDYLYTTVSDRLNSSDGGFSLLEISRYSGTIVDNELRERQTALINDFSQAYEKLVAAENSLSEANSQVSKVLIASTELDEKFNSAKQKVDEIGSAALQSEDTGRSSRISLRPIALALILGLFVGCFGMIIVELFSDRLNSKSELFGRYSFPLLGSIPSEKKRLFDKTIRRLEGESTSSFDTVALATARGLVTVSENHSVCFVSSLGTKTASILLPYLDGRIVVCGDILSDPEAVKSLVNYDSIILIEKRGCSNLSQIDSEVLRAKAFGKEILGIVLI